MNLIRLKNKRKAPFILQAWIRSSHQNMSVHCFLFAFLILLVNQISVSKGAPTDLDISTTNSMKSSVNNIQVANLTKESKETNETLIEKKAETSNNITIVKGANETQTGDLKLTNTTIANQLKIEINGTTIKSRENNDTTANSSKADIKKDESLKDEAKKTEALNREIKKNETKNDETTKVENKMTEAPKNDTKKEEPPKDDTKKDDAPKDDSKKDDAPKDDSKKDDAPIDDTQKEDSSKKNPSDDDEEKTADYDAPPDDGSPNQIKPPNNPKSDTDDVPPEKKAQNPPVPKQPSFDSLDDDEESSGGFLKYFLLISGFLVFGYLAYHNKSKIMGLIIEGRASRNQRRYNSRVYNRLENNQDSMTSINK